VHILSPRFPGRAASDPDMKILFGLQPKDKWPDDGFRERLLATNHEIAGNRIAVSAWVTPLSSSSRQGVPRCHVACPKCQKVLSFSRLPQHYRVHE